MRLRTKLVVVLVVLATVLGASLYGGLELYKEQVTEREHARATETATVVAAQIDATVREKRDFVGFAASRPEATSFSHSDHFARDLVSDSRFYAVQIIAANGTVVAFDGDVTAESRERALGSDVGDRPYVREALAGRIYVSDPETAATGEYMAVISAPIVDDGEVVGVLATAIYIDTSTVLTPVVPVASEHRSVAVIAGNETLYREGPTFDPSITGVARVESTGWTVRVSRDRATLDALLRSVGVAQALGVLFVLLVVSVIGGWQYRMTVSQINRLQRAFDAAGRGEYEYDISLSGGDEWREIATGFDELLDELAEREHALERRGQRLDVLNRVLRHNLRNDLGVILGYADMLRDAESADTRSAAELVHQRATTLVEVAEKARETQGLMADRSTDPGRIDIGSALHEAIEDLDVRFPAVRFDVDVPTSAYAVAIPRITAALRNVCENACEHNDAETPRVDVSLASLGEDRLRISVADNGPGIPSHEVDVLRRGHETQLDHGSGLGLWLVQWAVDGSGGVLAVESNDPRGTVVTIDLDAAPRPESSDG
ncbi:sensor histidine kinase [Salinigranum sp. GCM10025319]|uniref:sensor histidine kinase n=1 Tax=Salinigranum sp. GCM10025319 TaxID=3252687 RepID=UPI003615F636